MQFQSDITGAVIKRPVVRETTALGAAYLAGIAVGFWKDTGEVKSLWKCDASFDPQMTSEKREALVAQWHKAVGKSKDWAQ
jgi:glycerol kinase